LSRDVIFTAYMCVWQNLHIHDYNYRPSAAPLAPSAGLPAMPSAMMPTHTHMHTEE
jgi:hypothetical protein